MKHKYIFGIMIETDEPVTINNAAPLVEKQIIEGTVEIVSIEAVNDESGEMPY